LKNALKTHAFRALFQKYLKSCIIFRALSRKCPKNYIVFMALLENALKAI
jgi:hypothetical protein